VVAAEARDALGPAAVAVIVKQSRSAGRAEAPHPAVACAMLREAAARAVRERESMAPLRVAAPVTIEVTLASTAYADRAQLIEGVERVDGRTIRAVRPDVPAAYRLLRLVMLLCSAKE
jgi:D-amino peptidase